MSELRPGTKVYVRGFNDQEFELIKHEANQPVALVKLDNGKTFKTRAFPNIVCRLRCTFLTDDQNWRVPAIHVSKKPFSAIASFTAIATMFFTGVAQAGESNSIIKFCQTASDANISGISVAPGSELIRRIIRKGDLTEEGYLSVWRAAKGSIIPMCRGLW
jgi:hypothetical protein